MNNQRLRADHLKVGVPLPFDVYDTDGHLLLRRGYVISNGAQIERLVAQGLFADAAAAGLGSRSSSRADEEALDCFSKAGTRTPATLVSVFALLGQAGERLAELLEPAAPAGQFAQDIRAIADGIRRCCVLDGNAALAHILLSHRLSYPVRQAVNAAIVTAMLLERMHHDEARSSAAVAAALTMNISINDLQALLYSQAGKLTPEQATRIRAHPQASVEMLKAREVANPVWLEVVGQHHEAGDGTGYPTGVKAEGICREAQVVALADRYCSMVSERGYRPALLPASIMKELHARHSAAIDPALIAMLVAMMGLHPPGSFVELANGEHAVVTIRLLDIRHPVVFAVGAPGRPPYPVARKRLTASNDQFEIRGAIPSEQATVGFELETLWPLTPVENSAA